MVEMKAYADSAGVQIIYWIAPASQERSNSASPRRSLPIARKACGISEWIKINQGKVRRGSECKKGTGCKCISTFLYGKGIEFAAATSFFMRPPKELKDLALLPLEDNTLSSTSELVQLKHKSIVENFVACLFTEFQLPLEKKWMHSKAWRFQLKMTKDVAVPVFCCEGLGYLLGIPKHFTYLHAACLQFHDESHISPQSSSDATMYDVGRKLLLQKSSMGKNVKRKTYSKLMLNVYCKMKSTHSEAELGRAFQRKNRGESTVFVPSPNPVPVPTVGYFHLVFNESYPDMACTKSAFNRRFEMVRKFFMSNDKDYFLMASPRTIGHAILLSIKGQETSNMMLHDANVCAVSVSKKFLSVSQNVFVHEHGYNGTKKKLNDPTGDGRVLYHWQKKRQYNQLFDLFPSCHHEVIQPFVEQLLHTLVLSDAVPRTAKCCSIKANWIIANLKLSGMLHSDPASCKLTHPVHVQALHNCYTMEQIRSLTVAGIQLLNVFIPIGEDGTFMLICTETQELHDGSGPQHRVVYVPHGSALVLPPTVHHACGLQCGMRPSVIMQLQVAVNHQNKTPVVTPARHFFHYIQGPPKHRVASSSIESHSDQLCNLQHLCAMFLE